MNLLFFCFLVTYIKLTSAKDLIYKNHTCVPSTYTKLCILENPRYNPKDQHVIHSFPPNQSHVRILSGSIVTGKLHSLLGQPAVLEVQARIIWHLELPRALRQGIFYRSYIPSFSVEAGTETPKVVYLDLSGCFMSSIAKLKSLVNLEVLLLSYNYISTIDPDTMENLSKLRILDLSYNPLSTISLNIFPKSLTHLKLFGCGIESLNYDHLYYPSMQVLNLEQNEITSIDGSRLLLAMPNVKSVLIGGNKFFERDELQQALKLFRRQNVTFRDEAGEAACRSREQIFEGVCIDEPDPPRGFFRDVLLSFVVVLVVVALGATLRWVFRAMQGKS